MDIRHKNRISIVQDLFAYSFHKNTSSVSIHNKSQFAEIIDNLEKIDKIISSLAIKFPIDKIAKTDLAILRLAIFELSIHPNQPKKVIINEAVELAKELGGDKSYSFINGVLGKLMT